MRKLDDFKIFVLMGLSVIGNDFDEVEPSNELSVFCPVDYWPGEAPKIVERRMWERAVPQSVTTS